MYFYVCVDLLFLFVVSRPTRGYFAHEYIYIWQRHHSAKRLHIAFEQEGTFIVPCLLLHYPKDRDGLLDDVTAGMARLSLHLVVFT